MLKGQLSRVPWPGNLWMPFIFQAALQVLQQPDKHSYSLQLATHTELAHHYIHCFINSFSVLFFFKSKRISSKYQLHEMALEKGR